MLSTVIEVGFPRL